MNTVGKTQETKLLEQIADLRNKIQEFEKEASEAECVFDANDAKAEVSLCMERLIPLLQDALRLGMSTDEYPLVQELCVLYKEWVNPGP